MTIGIAAHGPGAAAAIVSALAAAESFASGAVGGFVSLAAIVEGKIERAEVQAGGTRALLSNGAASWLTASSCAVLMSSGPNRPSPLAQFTPGHPAIGFVTGHRFPNMADRQQRPLNHVALALIGSGLAPQAAVEAVARDNPEADAGFLAITPDGQIGLKDCAYLDQFPDRGHAILTGPSGIVAVVHNGIAPHRGLGMVVAELAVSRLTSPRPDQRRIEIHAGIPLRLSSRNAVEIDHTGRATALLVTNPKLMQATNSFGLGYHAEVLGADGYYLEYEPYMVAVDGVLASIDGSTIARLAIA